MRTLASCPFRKWQPGGAGEVVDEEVVVVHEAELVAGAERKSQIL
jgi:hypothetical protein